MEQGMGRGTDVMSPISVLIKVGVNWSWHERSLAQSSHTSPGDNHIRSLAQSSHTSPGDNHIARESSA